MFNPLDLFKSATETNSYVSSSHDKIRKTYVGKLNSIKFQSHLIQNSTSDYFSKAHSKMFVNNMEIFAKK